MSNHSPVGASSAYRWFACPGSVKLTEKAPPQEQSPYAAQGTAAHWVLEQCFPRSGDPWDYVGEEAPNGHTIQEGDAEAVDAALQFLNRECFQIDGQVHVERGFKIKSIHKDLWGTADVVFVADDYSVLKVFDYKHGKGIPVEVEDNPQLMYYGLGAIESLRLNEVLDWGQAFERVELFVLQPRCYHPDGPFRKSVVTPAKLSEFADTLREKVKEVYTKEAPLVAGDHCRFCPALTICPQLSNKVTEIAKVDFAPVSSPENLHLPPAEQLTAEDIGKALSFAPIIKEWLGRLEDHARGLLEADEDVPGFKLVRKRTHRKWISEEDAYSSLSLLLRDDQIFAKKMKSPSAIEKELKKDKKLVGDLAYTPEAGSTVAPIHDKRPAIPGSATTDFKSLNERKTNG